MAEEESPAPTALLPIYGKHLLGKRKGIRCYGSFTFWANDTDLYNYRD